MSRPKAPVNRGTVTKMPRTNAETIRIVSVLFLVPALAFGWGSTGHEVVARIAAANLTPAARTRVARILQVADTPEAVADAMAQASTWADETKSQTHTGAWHYIDLTLQDKASDITARCPENNCAPMRIEQFTAELQSGKPDQQISELDELRYVIHLVGDLHQPLHTITDDDEGGNCELLQPPVDEAKNLHALWDFGILNAMNTDSKPLAADLENDATQMGSHHRERLAGGSVMRWTWESHELAIRVVYDKLHVPVETPAPVQSCADAPADIRDFHPAVDALYVDDMKPVVRAQLLKAGLRLARLLNQSL